MILSYPTIDTCDIHLRGLVFTPRQIKKKKKKIKQKTTTHLSYSYPTSYKVGNTLCPWASLFLSIDYQWSWDDLLSWSHPHSGWNFHSGVIVKNRRRQVEKKGRVRGTKDAETQANKLNGKHLILGWWLTFNI